jgi:hypothetical protein
MLPDHMREELATQVVEHFGTEDPDLRKAALELQDAGWSWDAMRAPMTRIFNAGFDEGYIKGHDEA